MVSIRGFIDFHQKRKGYRYPSEKNVERAEENCSLTGQ